MIHLRNMSLIKIWEWQAWILQPGVHKCWQRSYIEPKFDPHPCSWKPLTCIYIYITNYNYVYVYIIYYYIYIYIILYIYIYNLCACAHLYTNDFSQSCSSTIVCKYFAAVDLLPEPHLLHEGRWCHFLWPEIECPSTTSPSNYPLFQSNPTGSSPREAIPNWPLTCCNNRTENKKNVGWSESPAFKAYWCVLCREWMGMEEWDD